MKKNLTGKVAVISGGASGIGLAIAKRLKKEDVKIYDISLNASEEEIFEKSFECDITDDEKLQKVLDEIVEKEKQIDFLFCNAGIGIGGLVENASLNAIDKIMNVNLTSQIKMTKLFLPYIRKGGKILYTGSLASIIPLPYQACYSASKAGIEIFGRALATEVRARKIKVTTFMPCDVNTNFTSSRMKETGSDKAEQRGIKKMEKSEHNGETADYVAKKVLKVVKKKKPPLRKYIGMVFPGATSGFIAFLVKILPVKWVNFLVRHLYI